jgi:hypothetical protein
MSELLSPLTSDCEWCLILRSEDQIQLTSRNNRWEDDFWFTGQIFDSFWEPRATWDFPWLRPREALSQRGICRWTRFVEPKSSGQGFLKRGNIQRLLLTGPLLDVDYLA